MTSSLSTLGSVSVVQIAFFGPFLIASIWMLLKHGVRSAGGSWRYITLLSLLRIIAGGCEIAAEHRPTDKALRTVLLICNSIGLAPLLLQCTGLITRANASINNVPKQIFSGANLVGVAGMVIALVGAVKAVNSSSGTFEINDFMVAGLSLFIALFAITLVAIIILATGISSLATSQAREHIGARRIVIVLAASVPLLAVRFIYACIGTYGKNMAWMPGMGDAMYYLGMAVIMEILMVTMWLALGITLPAYSKPNQVDQYKGYTGSSRV